MNQSQVLIGASKQHYKGKVCSWQQSGEKPPWACIAKFKIPKSRKSRKITPAFCVTTRFHAKITRNTGHEISEIARSVGQSIPA